MPRTSACVKKESSERRGERREAGNVTYSAGRGDEEEEEEEEDEGGGGRGDETVRCSAIQRAGRVFVFCCFLDGYSQQLNQNTVKPFGQKGERSECMLGKTSSTPRRKRILF